MSRAARIGGSICGQRFALTTCRSTQNNWRWSSSSAPQFYQDGMGQGMKNVSEFQQIELVKSKLAKSKAARFKEALLSSSAPTSRKMRVEGEVVIPSANKSEAMSQAMKNQKELQQIALVRSILAKSKPARFKDALLSAATTRKKTQVEEEAVMVSVKKSEIVKQATKNEKELRQIALVRSILAKSKTARFNEALLSASSNRKEMAVEGEIVMASAKRMEAMVQAMKNDNESQQIALSSGIEKNSRKILVEGETTRASEKISEQNAKELRHIALVRLILAKLQPARFADALLSSSELTDRKMAF